MVGVTSEVADVAAAVHVPSAFRTSPSDDDVVVDGGTGERVRVVASGGTKEEEKEEEVDTEGRCIGENAPVLALPVAVNRC